jgi:hypothetical protein
MRHLSAERLAAVADEHPTPDEAAHLAQCGQCMQGRDAHRRLIAGAALERDRTTAPLSSWGAISAQLRAEGIIRTPDTSASAPTSSDAAPVIPFARTSSDDVAVAPGPVAIDAAATAREAATPVTVTPLRRRAMPAWAMRAAAALVLVAGGVLAGRLSKPDGATPRVAQNETTPKLVGPSTPPTGIIAPVSVEQSPVYFASTDEARAAMLQAERVYRDAMNYLAKNDSTLRPPIADPVEAYRTRLAALDDAVTETRKALKLAPDDPVINNYYLTSVNARETTLRQIDDALPVNERVTRF